MEKGGQKLSKKETHEISERDFLYQVEIEERYKSWKCGLKMREERKKKKIKGMPLPGTHRTFGRNRQAPGSKSVEQGIYSVLMGEKIYEDVRGPTTAKFSC
ncbi:uncharacterized protein LOC125500341 isoform X1 [Athalia rosae]|uniref:uncharacterized protein LOC125500341 isoform X1 n=1 Tax=Athalia rosae TaxID=37344 RepID=UPI002033A9A2|nr:uncharacterized protein LOC125500341 isoform X1 [Athalia rosae]